MSSAAQEKMRGELMMATDQTERIRSQYFQLGYAVGHQDGAAGAPPAPQEQYVKLRKTRSSFGGKKTRASKKAKRSTTRRR